MVKRGRDSGEGAEPAMATSRAPLEAARQRVRSRCYRFRLAALNKSFCEAFTSFKDTNKSADGLVQQYMAFLGDLQSEYADVVVPLLPVPTRSGMCYVVGSGDFGQLGLGEDVTEKKRPTPLDAFGGPRQLCGLACGGMHTAALDTEGRVWTWGVNDDSALGRTLPVDEDSAGGQNQTAWTPGLVEGLPASVPAVKVAAGDAHSAALLADGSVWAWGIFCDKSGKLAFSADVKYQKTPACVYQPASPEDRIVDIQSSGDHVAMLSADERVLTMGTADGGCLGRFTKDECAIKTNELPEEEKTAHLRRMLTPGVVPGLTGVKSIGVGAISTFAVTAEDVYVFGLNNYGQLAIPEEQGREIYLPVRADALAGRRVIAMCGGDHHTLAVTQTGQLLSFGRPTYGRLGRTDVDVNSDDPIHTPELVHGFESDPVACAAAGTAVSACVTRSGACYSWGYGDTSMLGKPGEGDETTPHKLAASNQFSASGGITVSVGGQHMAWLAAPMGDLEGAARGAPKRKQG